MPCSRTAEKYKYLNYYYICLNNQSTRLVHEAFVHHANQCISIFLGGCKSKKVKPFAGGDGGLDSSNERKFTFGDS